MITVTVSAERPDIVIHPSDLVAEVLQNVRMILTTIRGTVPLDRDFGLTARVIDTPIDRAQALITAEVYEQLNRYEPRAQIVRVYFVGNEGNAADGQILPQVELRIAEDE